MFKHKDRAVLVLNNFERAAVAASIMTTLSSMEDQLSKLGDVPMASFIKREYIRLSVVLRGLQSGEYTATDFPSDADIQADIERDTAITIDYFSSLAESEVATEDKKAKEAVPDNTVIH